jgi:hypothetical protein
MPSRRPATCLPRSPLPSLPLGHAHALVVPPRSVWPRPRLPDVRPLSARRRFSLSSPPRRAPMPVVPPRRLATCLPRGPLPSLPPGHAPMLAVPLRRPAACSPPSPRPSTPSGRAYVLDCSPHSHIVCAAQPRAPCAGRRRCRRVRRATAASRPFSVRGCKRTKLLRRERIRQRGKGIFAISVSAY